MKEIENNNNVGGKTPEEIKKSIEVLRFYAKGATDAYVTHLTYGGKADQEQEEYINALDDGANALDLIQHLESHSPKWTNVAERLPQKPGKYLVYNSKVGTMYTSRFDPDIHKRWPHFGKVGVTHWKPRPEEPKEDAE